MDVLLTAVSSASNTKGSNSLKKANDLGLSWWLEVGTANPTCINYFGPFESQVQADAAKREAEKASRIVYSYSRFCQPRQRTITERELTIQDLQGCPPTFFEALLGQRRIY